MFLIIYKKGGKLFHNFQEKLSGTIYVSDEDFNNYRLTNKNRVRFFKMKTWSDFWKLKDKLEKYKLQMILVKNVYKGATEIGLNVFLLNNPIRSLLLTKREEGNKLLRDDEVERSAILFKTLKDFEEAEKDFDFESDIKNLIFGDEK